MRHECRENSSTVLPLPIYYFLLPPSPPRPLFPISHLLASKRATFNVYHFPILSLRNLGVRNRRSVFPPHSPTLDSDNDNNPRHQESDHAHRDREDKHSVQAIGFHCFYAVTSLKAIRSQVLQKGNTNENVETYTSHKNHPPSHQTERRDQLRRWSSRENTSRWAQVKQNVRSSSCERSSDKKGSPLRVDHRRDH